MLPTALQPTNNGSIPKPLKFNVFPMTYVPAAVVANTAATSSSSSTNSRVPRRILVLAKGIVGCGKSTFTQKFITAMQAAYEEANDGWSLVIADEGTDKYTSRKAFGEEPRQIVINNLTRYQQQANSTQAAYLRGKGESENEQERGIAKRDFVIIIDTCGDFEGVFGMDFPGWDQLSVWINLSTIEKVPNYLAWGVRNVLQREGHETLSVEKVGLTTCFEVAAKKASRHNMDSSSLLMDYDLSSLETALEGLRERADRYQAEVVDQFSIEENVKLVLSVLWGDR